MMCACPACAWCVPGVCLVCAWHAQALFFLTPPTPPGPHTCHAHTTTHATATCRCCRAITAVAACPSTIRGMRHTHRCRRRCHTPHVPPPCTRPRYVDIFFLIVRTRRNSCGRCPNYWPKTTCAVRGALSDTHLATCTTAKQDPDFGIKHNVWANWVPNASEQGSTIGLNWAQLLDVQGDMGPIENGCW